MTVLIDWYQVSDWRPPFSSFREAWSIRRYWGLAALLLQITNLLNSKFFGAEFLQCLLSSNVPPVSDLLSNFLYIRHFEDAISWFLLRYVRLLAAFSFLGCFIIMWMSPAA